ncbi:uncharacterized protein LOC105829264 isoform X1 [Monomorium pharaonis]|uniref:uncharacterized protein LOC105829264 isoform X1 n=1 Tax=Monomorium pharaonis TaxID=307658 RepID=UPI00063F3046|nr:uncharacterized protein LOC105829264 isoform X1 [Monomorium pharaonis]XP_036145468.1 uncharacterized protein LOC105829264 isoform X1 [Monomorium pharaonis]XP_036145470.1 uncharacterized protein LOC105829264 isoform X1 [Monomorium pharaonis]
MPFRNLKLLIILNKVLGICSCKLVNGRLKPSSTWSCCVCMLWVLFHCSYMATYYYMKYNALPTEKVKTDFILTILRFSIYFISLLPYNFIAAFWSQDIVKMSDKLLTYDERVIALGHQRKDKHIFVYLYFMYTLVTLSWKSYYTIRDGISEGMVGIITILQNIVLTIVGTYCVLVTCIFLDLIRQRFRHLNETIVPHVSQLPVTGSQSEITVYDVRYLHGVLLDSAELINTLYGIGTLLTFMSILLELVTAIYNIIKDMQEDEIVTMLDLLFQTIYLFAMYHFTTYEANRVEESVIKYGLSFSNKKCRMDKIEMMLYFYHRRYSFTAAEFFPLDVTIFLPIATAVITYLTLIV